MSQHHAAASSPRSFLEPKWAQGNSPEEVRGLMEHKYNAHFPNNQKWVQEEKLHPLINYVRNLWEKFSYQDSYRRNRHTEASYIHEFRVLHTVYNAPETPAGEKTVSALVAGGHDLFENARDHLNVTLSFLEVTRLLWPEPKDHAIIARAWELVTDPSPDKTPLARKNLVRIKHQQEVALSLRGEGVAGILAARVKVADKSDNFVTWAKDIVEGRLTFPNPEKIEALHDRTAANIVVIKNLARADILPASQTDRALMHGTALMELLRVIEPTPPPPAPKGFKKLLRQALPPR